LSTQQESAADLLGLPQEVLPPPPLAPAYAAQMPAEDLLLGLSEALPVRALESAQQAEESPAALSVQVDLSQGCFLARLLRESARKQATGAAGCSLSVISLVLAC